MMITSWSLTLKQDINTISGYYGAYCFHDGLTNLLLWIGRKFHTKKGIYQL